MADVTDDGTDPDATRPIPPPDPVLTELVVGIESHAAASGWDRPPMLYALVPTAELLAQQPSLAVSLGIEAAEVTPGDLTPVEQEALADGPLDEVLAGISWPAEVAGCALVHEVLVLPPGVEERAPDADDPEVTAWAAAQPERREVRMVAGVLRDGTRATVLRVRAADTPPADTPADGTPADDGDVLVGTDLAPALSDALLATLTD